jgi:hypothetical protein
VSGEVRVCVLTEPAISGQSCSGGRFRKSVFYLDCVVDARKVEIRGIRDEMEILPSRTKPEVA